MLRKVPNTNTQSEATEASRDRLARYHGVVADMDRVGVLAVDDRGVIQYASASAKAMLDFSESHVVGENIRNYLNPDDVDAVVGLLKRTLDRVNRNGQVPVRMLASGGTWRILEIVARHVVTEDSPEVVLGMIDASDRVRAQQRLKEVEEQGNRAQRVARVSNWELNTTNGSIVGSDQFFRTFGLSPRESLSFHELEEYIHPADRQIVSDAMANTRTSFEDLDVEFRIEHEDNQHRVLHFLGEIELVGKDLIMFGTAQDVTKSHRLNEQLVRSEGRLRSLMGRLHSAQEDERRRLARQVHDVLGQAMTAIRMEIHWIKSELPEGSDTLEQRVESTLGLVEETIQTVRRISHELRPGVLDHFGLAAALQWQADTFCERTSISCDFSDLANERIEDLDSDLSTALFRIFQEALTNVIRHAEATAVDASLDIHSSNVLVMTIADNGRGITQDEIQTTTSLGLLNMRERVLPWKGAVDVTGNDGAGTTVTVRVPIQIDERGNS